MESAISDSKFSRILPKQSVLGMQLKIGLKSHIDRKRKAFWAQHATPTGHPLNTCLGDHTVALPNENIRPIGSPSWTENYTGLVTSSSVTFPSHRRPLYGLFMNFNPNQDALINDLSVGFLWYYALELWLLLPMISNDNTIIHQNFGLVGYIMST